MVPQQERPPHTWSPIPASYGAQLTRLWTAWQESHTTADQRRLWAKALGAPPGQPVPRSQPHDWQNNCTREHFLAELKFYMDLERVFFAQARRLIRDELAAQQLLIGDGDHNDSISPFPHALSFNLLGDFLDGHGYWQHPDLGPPLRVKNTAMVNDPLDSTVVQFARTPVLGRPFTISETNHPFPHRYACEGFPILTAYALFQDWDGLLWFDWGPGRIRPATGVVQVFGFGNDPMKYANTALCGLWFHRGDVQAARQTVVRHISQDAALDSLRWDREQERPLPMAIEPVAGTVTLSNLSGATQVNARPLSALGIPQATVITGTRSGASGWSLPIGRSVVTTWYVVDVVRGEANLDAAVPSGAGPRHALHEMDLQRAHHADDGKDRAETRQVQQHSHAGS